MRCFISSFHTKSLQPRVYLTLPAKLFRLAIFDMVNVLTSGDHIQYNNPREL